MPRGQLALICASVFLIALGVRLLSWHDARLEAWKVQEGVSADYKRVARLLLQGGITSFLSPASPLSDPDTLGHPPGYSILIAFIYAIFGESDAAIQFIQIICDAAAAVVILLIAAKLLPAGVSLIAGLLVALSPQFAHNSVLLLPDTLAVLPILLAVYCLVHVGNWPRLATVTAAGALIGVSCWLRPNALLLAPFLALFLVPILFKRGQRIRHAAALVGGALIIIAPLTIRNAIVFQHFIPLSLGAGQTLLEGIGDYDEEGRFAIPNTDLGIMKMEAEMYNRPDYMDSLFGPDGVRRERMRLARGFEVIRSNPTWFLGVMVHRAASMFRLERARLISVDPPVTHSLAMTNDLQAVWASPPSELLANATAASPQAEVSLAPDGRMLRLAGDYSKYGDQIAFESNVLQKNTDYVFKFPLKLEQGRVMIRVLSASDNSLLASTVINTVEGRTPEQQPVTVIQLPFVSGDNDRVRVLLSNGGSTPVRPVVLVGQFDLFALGPASYLWTRYLRAPVRALQKFFLTAWMLPLTLIGAASLLRARRGRILAIMLIVPAYYLCIQSSLHTEYRYVMAIHYFLFGLVAVALYWIGGTLWRSMRSVASSSMARNSQATPDIRVDEQ
ncbi:MAG TPA: glycosyltransferase family 39 protein [Pyrinomonadaceae bacterium]|nr:glycosyltransferase family 39 protein [Pyrinomonadaceae bacterium]